MEQCAWQRVCVQPPARQVGATPRSAVQKWSFRSTDHPLQLGIFTSARLGTFESELTAAASRSRTRGWRTATRPIPVILALRQVPMADDALVAVRGLQIGMPGEKVCNFGFARLGEKGTCPVAQNFCELIVEHSWFSQMTLSLETAY